MIPWKGVFLHIILPEEPALHWGPGQSLVSLDHLWKETPAGTEQWPLTSLSSCLLTLALLPGFITQASPGFCCHCSNGFLDLFCYSLQFC